jgi:pilus assembly protein CpaB
MNMKIKILPLVVSVGCGLLAVVLISVYLQQKERVIMGNKPKTVSYAVAAVATLDVPKGTVIKESMVDLKKIPEDYLQPRVATSLERVVGKTTIADIAKGEQILLSKISYPEAELTLSMKTPPGKRAIAITVDAASSLGGAIKVGDKVDIIATIPIPVKNAEGKAAFQNGFFPLFQNVPVLAGGGGSAPGEKGSAGTLILALNPQEAAFVTLLQEQGKLKLALRGPNDVQYEPVQPATQEALIRYVFGEQPQPPPLPPSVEIYRGVSKGRSSGATSTSSTKPAEEAGQAKKP